MNIQTLLRALPKIDRLAEDSDIARFYHGVSRTAVIDVLRDIVEENRLMIINGDYPYTDEAALFKNIKNTALQRLGEMSSVRLKRVINATGVVLHTNLGRAQLSKAIMAEITETVTGYCNLEYSVSDGKRSNRNVYIENQIKSLTGAEASLVVNNNAAAVYLTLSTLCTGREVVVSRGEIVEIGDSFRIMDIIENSGCVIREIGTTNHTRLSDYEKHINENTGALLKVHRSNFKITGFTGETTARELSALRDKYACLDVIVMDDMGSGLLPTTAHPVFKNERTVSDALRDGVDIVTFSGDKLLGGPQAGIIAGKKVLIERIRKNPLYRCLRIDKLCLAALDATLRLYIRGEYEAIPVMKALLASQEQIKEHADILCGFLAGDDGITATAAPHEAVPGGGARPGEAIDSYAVYINSNKMTVDEMECCLRKQPIPIIATIKDNQLVLDMRTVDNEDIPYIARCIHDMLME